MELAEYINRSIHLGINQRMNGRLLDDMECMDAVNVDLSIPGSRSKRLGPSTLIDLDHVPPTIPPVTLPPTTLAPTTVAPTTIAPSVCLTGAAWSPDGVYPPTVTVKLRGIIPGSGSPNVNGDYEVHWDGIDRYYEVLTVGGEPMEFDITPMSPVDGFVTFDSLQFNVIWTGHGFVFWLGPMSFPVTTISTTGSSFDLTIDNFSSAYGTSGTLEVIGSCSTGGTTIPPTTLAPTTLAPTTAAPTTLPPTTLLPTTLPPTTLPPTTIPPTTLPPPPASCESGGPYQEVYYVTGWNSFNFGACSIAEAAPIQSAFNGALTNGTWPTGCVWEQDFVKIQEDSATWWFMSEISVSLVASTYWLLKFIALDPTGTFFVDVWIGTKTTGTNPLGVYTQTSGCATGVSTITVSASP